MLTFSSPVGRIPASQAHGRSLMQFICGAVLLFSVAVPRASAELQPGELFPPLQSAGLIATQVPEISGRVAVVDFWASWCAPCKASFPFYSALYTEKAASGLVILGVSVDQDQSAYSAFVGRLHPTFSVALDRDQKLVSLLQIPAMPTCFVIDRSGRVRFVHSGFHGADTEKLLRDEVALLLAERTP